jgi:septal ring factor EnvC (AmiA/AmiB activator)
LFWIVLRLAELLAKRQTIDDLTAELEVLKAEHSSLKNFLKESSEKETKEKKEREAKHAKDMLDLAEKLKTSNQRIKTLAAKSKSYESEAADIDKMIFRKDFLFLRLPYCFHPSLFPEN